MAEPLKNSYNPRYLEGVAQAILGVVSSFPSDEFIDAVLANGWDDRELKDRMYHITRCLDRFLGPDYLSAIEVLKDVASDFGGFEGMFIPAFVELFGLDDWDISLPALAEFTKHSSSEFAVRPFIQQDPDRMMEKMLEWASDENLHVRRLASEGCRPRLPWAMALPEFKRDPTPILPILDRLKADPELYVRRSVANNVNDISKDHPALVLELCESWSGDSEATDRLVKHACRSLLKAGNTRALRLFGFGDPDKISIERLSIGPPAVRIGESTHFSFDLVVSCAGKLRLEYAIDFVKKRGSRSRKVFQIKEDTFEIGRESLRRKHSFANLSTRQHYPGEHSLAILINGLELGTLDFEVRGEASLC